MVKDGAADQVAGGLFEYGVDAGQTSLGSQAATPKDRSALFGIYATHHGRVGARGRRATPNASWAFEVSGETGVLPTPSDVKTPTLVTRWWCEPAAW